MKDSTTIKKLIDKVYEDCSQRDDIDFSEIMYSKQMKDLFNELLIKNGVDVEWMTSPRMKYESCMVMAKTYKLKGDDIEAEIKELYEKHGSKFHPYMFNKVISVFVEDIPDGLSDDEMNKLPKEDIYMLRFRVEE